MSEELSAWIGRRREVSDVLDPARTNALRAALGEVRDGLLKRIRARFPGPLVPKF